jgi:hypothetical protein
MKVDLRVVSHLTERCSGLKGGPLGKLNAIVLEVLACVRENPSSDFASSSEVEVVELVGGSHRYTGREDLTLGRLGKGERLTLTG